MAVTAVIVPLPFLATARLRCRLSHPVAPLLAVVRRTVTGSRMIGGRPLRTRHRDRATSQWPQVPLATGESPHHLHHADPTCARHGVDGGRLAPSAVVIRLLDGRGRLHDARRPMQDRGAARGA